MKQADQDIIQLLREIKAAAGGGAAAVWGGITGLLSSQSDLWSVLGEKQTAAQVQALIDAAVPVNGMGLLSSTTVATDFDGSQTLYTVPADRRAFVTRMVMRDASASLAAINGDANVAISGGQFDAFSTARMALMTTSGQALSVNGITSSVFNRGGEGGSVDIQFTDASHGPVATVVVDVFGYLTNESGVPVKQ